MRIICPTTIGLDQDEKFQRLKKAYKDRNLSDYELLMALQTYREKEDLDIDFYPEIEEEYKAFTNYLDSPAYRKPKNPVTKESINALYKTITTLYSPSMLNNRINRIATIFSDYVTRLVNNSTFGVTRQQAIQNQGTQKQNGFDVILDRVFDYIKQLSTLEGQIAWYKSKNKNLTDSQLEIYKPSLERRAAEFAKMYDNKETLGMLAALKIGAQEGFAVSIDGLEYNFTQLEELESLQEENADGIDSEEAQKGDRYVDYRSLPLMSTLSTEARLLLSKLYMLDRNGNIVRDDLNYPVAVDMKQAVIALHKVLRSSTPETMMDDIKRATTRYPWMRSLVAYLNNNPDAETLVYCNFKKARSSYFYGRKDNRTGRLLVRQVNNVADGSGLSREAGVNLSNGVAESNLNIVDSAGNLKDAARLDEIKKAVEAIGEYANRNLPVKPVAAEGADLRYATADAAAYWKALVDEKPESDFEQLADVLRGLGFSLDASDVKYAVANSAPIGQITGTRKNGETPQVSSMTRIVNALNGILERAGYILDSKDDLTGSHLYNYAADEYKNLANVLSAIEKHEVEERSISNKKALAASTTPNALHELVDKLSNVANLSDQEYKQMLMNDFGQYEGMALGFGNNMRLTGWLADLYNDGKDGSDASFKKLRNSFQVVDFTDLNLDSQKDFATLSSVEHLLNSYVMYARGTEGRTSGLSGHLYEVPIQADYETAYNFIAAPDYTRDELVERLAQEVECEAQRISAIRERKANDPKSGDPIRAIPNVYEKRGVQFQIFPELNSGDFISRYRAASSTDAHELVKAEVDALLTRMLETERKNLKDKGFFSADNRKLAGFKDANDKSIDEWLLNSFYARQQITKLMYGGLEHFKSTTDFEKRNMYSHATRLPMNTKATYRGEKVGRDNQRVIYLADDEVRSSVYDKIAAVADRLVKEKKITPEQAEQMKDAYKSITTTDGQGLRTFDSMRAVKIMSSIWTDSDELAYQRIKNGNYTPQDIQHFVIGIKPVYTGYEVVPPAEGKYQKPVRVPVLHKYSEMVLLPEMVQALGIQNATAPFAAMNKVNDALGKGNEIDLFIFGSGVKVGAHSVIDAFAKDKDNNRILKSSDDLADFISGKVKNASFWVHTLPFKYYGITSSMHADVVDEHIAWATQAEKEAWGNIQDGEKLSVADKEMDSRAARELFYKIKSARTIDTFKRLSERLADKTEIARMLKEELSGKSYQSRELIFALQMRDNGKMAYPLYSPNIQHDATALLASVVKKQFTKVPTKGANMTQTTSFGMDAEVEAQGFNENLKKVGFEPLEVKFDDNGNFQYVEVYAPMYDSRFVQFADKNGNITPAALRKLNKDGYIPESVLNFIAYRTPSDAEHSIIPCRIKGFISNTAGASIRMPQEIMKMTGHDYDGDKMRCHFKEFTTGWNYDMIANDFRKFQDTEFVQAVIQKDADPTLTPYEVFKRNITSGQNPNSEQYRALKEVKYNYDKSPLDNIGSDGNYNALNNALVDLIFAQLTSENGGLKMFIPGGCEETKQYANSIGTRQSGSATASPFTVSHATDSHDYMMQGAGMIGVYAVYNSAASMFQRLNLRYIQDTDRDGNLIPVSLFGKPIDKLFPVLSNGTFSTLGMARLLNAAVDNGKDPLLGYLNQTAELSPLTNFLLAAGLSEEELHLIMNQPVMKELAEKLKTAGSDNFTSASNGILQRAFDKLPKDIKGRAPYYRNQSVANVAAMSKDSFEQNLGKSFSNMLNGPTSQLENQVYILQTMQHLYSAASDLEEFTKLTRPESDAGGIDASLGGIISKLIQLDKFREKIASGDVKIAGVDEVLRLRNIYENSMTPELIQNEIGNELPEVVALNSLMKDSILKMLRDYFPQARESWLSEARRIADKYSYDRLPASVIERIGNDMILWKLLSDPAFITGNPQDEQERIVKQVPNDLRDLKRRIEKAKGNPGTDFNAEKLKDNIFLNNLDFGTTLNSEQETIGRIRFRLNGASLEDTSDTIRADWSAMLYNPDPAISQLALDLFKYNLYTNGFSYGRYEFAHFAPASVIFATPGYLKALNNVLTSNWAADEEELFYHQYMMNHWGDKNLLQRFTPDKLPLQLRTRLGYTNSIANPVSDDTFNSVLNNADYILVRTIENNKTEDKLFMLVRDLTNRVVDLKQMPKLGIRNRSNQVIVQYNPRVRSLDEVKPVFTSNSVAWESRQRNAADDTQIDQEVADDTARQRAIDEIPFSIPIVTTPKHIEKLQEETGKTNDGKLTAEQAAALGFEDEGPVTVTGENISSSGSDFAKQLTNPGNNLTVEYKGTTFRNAEHAYQTWKSGTFDEAAYNSTAFKPVGSKPADKSTNYQTMVDILTAKLQQHPELVRGIRERGGEAYLNASTHNVTGDKYWETDSGQNKFLQALTDAYRSVSGGANSGQMFYIAKRDKNGNITTGYFPESVEVVEQARIQQAFHDLNERLFPLFAQKGVGKQVIYDAEARIAQGLTDFGKIDPALVSAEVLAHGTIDLIQLANGIEGEYALPEEMAHVAIEMLGEHRAITDDEGNVVGFAAQNKLVERLLNLLNNDERVLREAYNGQYETYQAEYGEDNREKLVTEAAGKLVAKHLFLKQYIQTKSARSLVQRICDAIKNFFRNFNVRDFWDAIFGANHVASRLAKDLLSGRLADEMSLDKITRRDKFMSIEKDLSGKKDLLSKMLKYTGKLRDTLQRRMKYSMNKGASSRSLDVTEQQLSKLEHKSQNQKLEITVTDYLKDTMSFMAEMERDLDAAINNRPANAVCKKLRIVKDTMYSFASVIKDVREALATGELEDDVNLKGMVKDVSDEVERFWSKYNKISMMYFEQFLSNVYGKDGVTVNIGRDKGRKISIQEMARYADRDISMASRLLSAVSDCNDYVLQAIDDVTRDAKLNARRRVNDLRPRLEAAMEALIKEQGSRDQSWMFEKRNGARTGKYISEKQAEKLSDAKKNFYKVFMELKYLADECMPEGMVPDTNYVLGKASRKMIMFRKENYEKMKAAQGVQGKKQEAWEAAKRGILEMGDIDFENEEVIKDFEGNIVDQLPIKFLNKGKNETYDDMTEDAATSLMAYLGMAFEYREMNNVVGLLENARYMSSLREVKQHRGLKNLINRVGDESKNEFHYQEPFTVKQARSNIQAAMNDFFQMHVYGHLQKNEGTIGKTRISKRKLVNNLVGYTSLMQMALNLHQRIANVNTGLTQIVVETAGKEITIKDVMKAAGIWTKESADRLAEVGKTDYNNKLSLWMDRFDIHQDNGRENSTTKYGRTRGSRVFNSHLLYAGLTIGEDYLSGTTALAYALNYKMKGPNGEDSNLWDAYKVDFLKPTKYDKDGNAIDGEGAYLTLKPGYTKADGSEFTFEDEKKFAKKVIGTNFELQGIYNVDDRSAIQQHSLGALAIMYRKWIAPAIKRRYAGVQYSKLKEDYTEGYYRTALRTAGDVIKDWFSPVSEEDSEKTVLQMLFDIKAMKDAAMLNWDKLTDYEKGNVKKAFRELCVVLGLFVASALLTNLPPDDHDGDKFLCWADDIVVTQLLRLRSEIGSQAPTPQMLNEALRIGSSPIAALRPVTDGVGAVANLLWVPNYFDTVESGRYKGRTKAHKYFMKLPVVSLFRKFDNFIDPSDMLNFYKNQNY